MNDTRENVASLLREAKHYYSLEKDYLRYTAAEQLTSVISALVIGLVVGVVGFTVLIFGGLGLANVIGQATGQLGLCYMGLALAWVILLAVLWWRRRQLFVLPIARLMIHAFTPEEETKKDDKQEGGKK